jgi:hypothetical protein
VAVLQRVSLVRRHREFVLRHNSELDACGCGLRAAQSDATLVKDIVRKERARSTHTQGRQAKQSLLNAFASPNNDPPAAGAAASLPHAATVDVEGSHALSGAGTASARKRSKRTSAAAASTTAPLKSPRRVTSSTPAILDLSSDDINPDDPSAEMRDVAAIPSPAAAALTSCRSLRSRAPSTAEHAAATAAAVPPVGASTAAALLQGEQGRAHYIRGRHLLLNPGVLSAGQLQAIIQGKPDRTISVLDLYSVSLKLVPDAETSSGVVPPEPLAASARRQQQNTDAAVDSSTIRTRRAEGACGVSYREV